MNTVNDQDATDSQPASASGALDYLIARMDAAMEAHLSKPFGPKWRTMCHQSARIAAAALNMAAPALKAQVVRVELLAKMMGEHHRLVHIGWAADPDALPGRAPMHFAVQFGDALYDPTFWQLSQVKTPLDLPPEPYFFSDRFCGESWRREAMSTVVQTMPSGVLRVVYKRVDHLRGVPVKTQMTEANVKKHAQLVIKTFKSMLESPVHSKNPQD